LLRLGPEMLTRYGNDFVAAWNRVFDRLKFKPLAADKPQYLALSAAASPTRQSGRCSKRSPPKPP
jgi:type VI secretion system protein ImpL